MKKTMLAVLISMLTLFGRAYAEMTFGVSAALTTIDASGTETEGGETNNGAADNIVVIPSIFVEFETGNLSVGLDYIPMDADVSDKTKKIK